MTKWTKPVAALPRSLSALVLLIAIACAAGASNQVSQMPAPQDRTAGGASVPAAGRAWLVFGNDTVNAEVASTPAQRSQGLMGRPEVPVGTGMLFVFGEEEVRSFWMRNTLVPLDIAFMDSEFRVVDIQQMEANSEDFHESRQPAMYALEVQKGWLAAHGVRIGTKPRVVFGS